MALASMLEQQSKAVFAGEATPARPITLLGSKPVTLANSGISVYITGTLNAIAGPVARVTRPDRRSRSRSRRRTSSPASIPRSRQHSRSRDGPISGAMSCSASLASPGTHS